MRQFIILVLFGFACTPSVSPQQNDSSPVVIDAPAGASAVAAASAQPEEANVKGGSETFEATLRIAPRPADRELGSESFQGVWLERDDGSRWLIANRPHGYWIPFEGERVTVVGERYEPQAPIVAPAVGAQHFRVESMTVDPQSMARFVRVAEERALTGTFEQETMPAGTKAAGAVVTSFVSGGMRYLLANSPTDEPPPGTKVRIRARQVELSPFAAHTGGPRLWIIAITPVD